MTVYLNSDAMTSINDPARTPTIGYAHPGDPTLTGVVIPGGQIETRSINVGEDVTLRITTIRCECLEVSVMEPIEGGRQ
jgi:hypothetical protein